MLWNNLMCLDCLGYKSLSLKIFGSKRDNQNFDFIKILKQIIDNFSKFQQTKNNLIYAEMVKILRWYSNIKERRQPLHQPPHSASTSITGRQALRPGLVKLCACGQP